MSFRLSYLHTNLATTCEDETAEHDIKWRLILGAEFIDFPLDLFWFSCFIAMMSVPFRGCHISQDV